MAKTKPKITVNNVEYELLAVKDDSDYGYGNHSFEGVARKDEKYYWVYSSGCSCNGTAHTAEIDKKKIKTVEISEKVSYELGGKSIYDGPDLAFSDY